MGSGGRGMLGWDMRMSHACMLHPNIPSTPTHHQRRLGWLAASSLACGRRGMGPLHVGGEAWGKAPWQVPYRPSALAVLPALSAHAHAGMHSAHYCTRATTRAKREISGVDGHRSFWHLSMEMSWLCAQGCLTTAAQAAAAVTGQAPPAAATGLAAPGYRRPRGPAATRLSSSVICCKCFQRTSRATTSRKKIITPVPRSLRHAPRGRPAAWRPSGERSACTHANIGMRATTLMGEAFEGDSALQRRLHIALHT